MVVPRHVDNTAPSPTTEASVVGHLISNSKVAEEKSWPVVAV